MPEHPVSRLYLTGLPGTGKSTIGLRVARLLGWAFQDTDALVEYQAGTTIASIFAEAGEPRFRELERAALQAVAAHERVVVATGGGVVLSAANRELMAATGWRVWLAAMPDCALARIGGPRITARPLLTGGDLRHAMAALLEQRAALYAEAELKVDTEHVSEEAVAMRIVGHLVSRGLVSALAPSPTICNISVGPRVTYDAIVEWGGIATLGDRLRALGVPPRLHLVSDATVAGLYADGLVAGLRGQGFEPTIWTMPPGEANKSRDQFNALHDWLAEQRAERREAIVAVGGGVVGDLAGYAAATYLRGVPFVQFPTSLLAQVDASIGGKVGIDHPRGKNLLGAFHHPALVLADPATLLTLPQRTYVEGFAEMVKHGVALDASYFAALEHDQPSLAIRDPSALVVSIAGSVALKAAVVQADEHERDGGRRQLLNYGHTIGHALETLTGYGSWLHGEAVAIGMAAAARIGERLGLTPADVVGRQDALLAALGLPSRLPAVPAASLMRAALWDKKVRGGRIQWVLLTGLGLATIVSDVPDEVVRAVLLDLGATDEPNGPDDA